MMAMIVNDYLPVLCDGQYCMYRTTLRWPGMSGPGMYEQAGQQPRQVVQPRILLVQNSQLYQLVQQAQFQTVTIKRTNLEHFHCLPGRQYCGAGPI